MSTGSLHHSRGRSGNHKGSKEKSPHFQCKVTSLVAQLVKNLPSMLETLVQFLGQEEIPWRRDRLPTPVFLGFLGGSDGKESACNVEDLGSIPRLGRSPGGGHGNALQYSFLESPHGQRGLAGYRP